MKTTSESENVEVSRPQSAYLFSNGPDACYAGTPIDGSQAWDYEKEGGRITRKWRTTLHCGCKRCQPENWCRFENCQRPVEAMLKTIHKQAKSREYCFIHVREV